MMPDETPPTDEQSVPFPTEGRLLGIDYGTVRLGFAISTPDQTIAGPIDNYTRRSAGLDEKHILEIAKDYFVAGLVVGLPVHMSGDEGGVAGECRKFGAWVSEFCGVPVTYWDERFTSIRAEQALLQSGLSKKKRQARMDKLAAQFMLQSFLDAENRDQAPSAI